MTDLRRAWPWGEKLLSAIQNADQRLSRNRFGKEVDETKCLRARGQSLTSAAHQTDWPVDRAGADGRVKFVPVHSRHLEIGHDAAPRQSVDLREKLRSVGESRAGISHRVQEKRHGLEYRGIIVDDVNVAFFEGLLVPHAARRSSDGGWFEIAAINRMTAGCSAWARP